MLTVWITSGRYCPAIKFINLLAVCGQLDLIWVVHGRRDLIKQWTLSAVCGWPDLISAIWRWLTGFDKGMNPLSCLWATRLISAILQRWPDFIQQWTLCNLLILKTWDYRMKLLWQQRSPAHEYYDYIVDFAFFLQTFLLQKDTNLYSRLTIYTYTRNNKSTVICPVFACVIGVVSNGSTRIWSSDKTEVLIWSRFLSSVDMFWAVTNLYVHTIWGDGTDFSSCAWPISNK